MSVTSKTDDAAQVIETKIYFIYIYYKMNNIDLILKGLHQQKRKKYLEYF